MTKRIWVFLMTAVLFCMLAGCSGETEQIDDVADTPTTEVESPVAEPVDYTAFCGHYSDTETVEGPCYTVSILIADNETKEIEIQISYVGPHSSPVYTTEPIKASIAEDHTVEFAWTDSWSNEGNGTLVLDPDDLSEVQLMMTVTKEAEVNRATLSTHDEHKILTRRADEIG